LPMLESIYFDGKSPLNFFPKVSKWEYLSKQLWEQL
jgi:hypothetical protein